MISAERRIDCREIAMSMTPIYNEFNTAVLRLALAHIAQGNYQELADMGFTPEVIAELHELRAQDFVMLSSADASAACVTSGVIDPERILHLVRAAKERRKEEEMILEFVRLRAPRWLMRDLFGITADDYCRYRRQVGLAGEGMGRPELPDEEKQIVLWRLWKASKDQPEKERYLFLARESGVPLNSALRALKQWESQKGRDAQKSTDAWRNSRFV